MTARSLPTLLAAITAATLAGTSFAHADRSVLMVLDASGSMTQRLADGQSRMDAAKAAVEAAVAKMGDAQRVGLRVYGHTSSTSARNCEDTSLVTPIGAASSVRAALADAMRPLSAKGYTPITLSLEKAAGDLKSERSEEKVIVLVSDGRETCKGDPCATAKAMAAADASLIVHTIGFGVDDATRTQLQCIANVARGTYFDAERGDDLSRRLGEASQAKAPRVAPPPAPKVEAKVLPARLQIPRIEQTGEPQVINPDTDEAVSGAGWMSGAGVELPAGIYNLKFMNGLWRGVQLTSGKVNVLQAGFLVFKGGNKPQKGFFYMIDPETGERLGENLISNHDRHAMIPGRFHIELPDLPLIKDVEFKAGQVTTVDVGLVTFDDALKSDKLRSYVLTTADGHYSKSFSYFAATPEIMTLPLGRYTLRDSNDANRPDLEFEVTAGPQKVVYK
jgi:von Willebrand factor type A domain